MMLSCLGIKTRLCVFQVVREACITIAYMSQQLRHKVDRFCEALMQVKLSSYTSWVTSNTLPGRHRRVKINRTVNGCSVSISYSRMSRFHFFPELDQLDPKLGEGDGHFRNRLREVHHPEHS